MEPLVLPIKVLLLSSNPRETTPLRLDEERREIESGLVERSRLRDDFRVITKVAVRSRDVQRAMLDNAPQIVHFSGHGYSGLGVALEDEAGAIQCVDAEDLAGLFKLFADRVQCVVLNACYSESQADAIAQHIPYVIGMSHEVGDKAAIEFSVGFYDALGAGRDVEFAFNLGCSAIRMAGISEELKPVLKKKPEIASVTSGVDLESADVKRLSVPELQKSHLSLSTYNAETWVGRESLIAWLASKLQNGCRILALVGITGIGKTALAERLVLQISSQDTPFHRLNFDDRGQGHDFISGALSLLPKLGEVLSVTDQQDPQQALRHLVQVLRNKPFLVQIDSMEMLFQGDEKTRWNAFIDPLWVDFFQQLLAGEDCQSQLIITTQALPEDLEIVGSRYSRYWHRQDLEGLSAKEQLQLFANNGLLSDDANKECLQRIGQLYEGHPLVIQVIAREIMERPFNGNVSQYWQRYEGEFSTINQGMEGRSNGLSSRRLELKVKRRVENALKRLPADAYQMLCRSSVYRCPVPESFWLEMMTDLSIKQKWCVLDFLRSHNLVEEKLSTNGSLLLRQHNLIKGTTFSLLKRESIVWRNAEYSAYQSWMSAWTDGTYQPEPDSPPLEKLREPLEAFYHACEIEDWEAAKNILIDKQINERLFSWCYFWEMIHLNKKLLSKSGLKVEGQCEVRIGGAYLYLGNFPQSTKHLERSLRISREIHDQLMEETVLRGLGGVFYLTGKYSQATQYYQQSLAIARAIGDRLGEGNALGNLGGIKGALGNYPVALNYIQQNLAISQENHDRRGECLAIDGLGYIYHKMGEYFKAIEYYHKSLEIARELGDRMLEGNTLCIWGETLFRLNQYPESLDKLKASLLIFQELGARYDIARNFLVLARLNNRTGDSNLAKSYCEKALSLAIEMAIPLAEECRDLYAELKEK